MKNQLVKTVAALIIGMIIGGGITYLTTNHDCPDKTAPIITLDQNYDGEKFLEVPRREYDTVLSHIATYDSFNLMKEKHITETLSPTKIIIHTSSSLDTFAAIYKTIISELDAHPGELNSNYDSIKKYYKWQLGIYPAIKLDKEGRKRLNLYFIPTLCRPNYDTADHATDYYKTGVLDYRNADNRKYYTQNEALKSYIYDAGNMWP